MILLTSIHDSNEIDPETQKPLIILDYNRMCSTSSVARKTRTWPLVLSFRGLDISGINLYKIFLANTGSSIRRRQYLTDLAMGLMEENLKARSRNGIDEMLQKHRSQHIQKKICFICGSYRNAKTGVTCDTCNRNKCKNHSLHRVTCQACLHREN